MKFGKWTVQLFGAIACVLSVRAQSEIGPNPNDVETARDHVIMVDEDGTYKDPGDKWNLADTKGAKKIGSLQEQLERIERKLASISSPTQPIKLLVFAHGGLVTYAGSQAAYQELLPLMTDKKWGYYPIFIVWNSGWWTTYLDHLVRVRQGEVLKNKTIGVATAPIIFSADMLSAVGRAPVVWGREAANDIRTTEFPKGKQATDHDAVENYLQKRYPGHFVLGTDRRSNCERIAYGTSYVLTTPFKYLIASPIIDGLGAKAWDNMLRRTKAMFDPNPRSQEIYDNLYPKDDLEAQTKVLDRWFNKRPGVMRQFGDQLSCWTRDKQLNVELELYGHSMGTIIINNMLQSSPNMRVKRIVYLAAACSIRDWESSIWPYMAGPNNETKFFSLSLNRLREESERNPPIFGINSDLAPRGSLLNWIDGFLENPKTSEDRTLGSWTNLTQIVPQIPIRLMDRMYFHCFDAVTVPTPSVPAQPQSHGEVASWEFWQESYINPHSNAETPPRISSEPLRPLSILNAK